MTVNKYGVNWSDQAFPRIERADQISDDPEEWGKSFAEAKAEIIEHFTYLRDHARDQIARTRKLRASDIKAGD